MRDRIFFLLQTMLMFHVTVCWPIILIKCGEKNNKTNEHSHDFYPPCILSNKYLVGKRFLELTSTVEIIRIVMK